MVATREIMWMRAITAASAGSASLISIPPISVPPICVPPTSLTAGTYRVSRNTGHRITRRTFPVTALAAGRAVDDLAEDVGVANEPAPAHPSTSNSPPNSTEAPRATTTSRRRPR